MRYRCGIELEFASRAGPEFLTRLMGQLGLTVKYRNGGNSNGRFWELKPDGSVVTPELAEDGWRGYELASAILSDEGDNRLQAYMRIMDKLACCGICIVPPTAGMHVHIEVKDYTWMGLSRLVKLMLGREEALFDTLPPSRRANGYCRSIRHNIVYQMIANAPNEDYVQVGVQLLTENRLDDRYFGLNLTDYTRRRTVEFRYGAGTLEHSKAKRWIKTLGELVERAALETGTLETEPLRMVGS